MIHLRKPPSASIREYVARQATLDFTYSAVGATATNPPDGWAVDRTRFEIGNGEAIFDRAQMALQRWQHFELGWVAACPTDTPIRAGETLAVTIRAFGLWWINSARIVYTVDESTDIVSRFGFAYGTLPGHVEAGEERFLVEWDRTTDRVYYDILAFSRPRHILTRLAKREVRRMQKRFAGNSAAAMLRAVREGEAPAEQRPNTHSARREPRPPGF